jgi:acetyltransferase-like isoleucine patch superfamily enzyme
VRPHGGTMWRLIRRVVGPVWQRVYRVYAVRQNVVLGEDVHIGIGTILEAPRRLEVGNNVYIGKRCTIECDGAIGSNVIIANHCGLVGRYDHDFRCVGIPMRDAPWIGDPGRPGPGARLELEIGDDVWIGYGAIVLTGVRVGRGALVSAGSLVVRNVEPYSIVAGVPASRLGFRFNPEQIREHEKRLYGAP